MLDTRYDTIVYQSEIYYINLIETLVDKKKLGKALESKWRKADRILGYLEELNFHTRLQDANDITNVTFILEELIDLCEINSFPTASPLQFQAAPAILYGIQGPQGNTGPQGATGATGGGTDFEEDVISTPTIVDSFPFADGNMARWDFVVIEDAGAQRAGTVIGTWSTDGSASDTSGEIATADLVASTDGIEFEIQIVGSDVQFIANVTIGTWLVRGKRYLI